MSDESETVRRRSWLANAFILIAILLVVTIVGLLMVWMLTPKQFEATALFRVSREQPSILEDEFRKLYDKQEYQVLKNTQLAALRHDYVLTAALRKPGIASLSAFAGNDDPIDWLSKNLEVEYPEDGEYLAISLKGSESQMDDFVRIINAVAEAYSDEVIFKDRAMRLSLKDRLARSLQGLQKKISDKRETYYLILKESGRHGEATAETLRQLNFDRLGRLEVELSRLESEQLKQKNDGQQSDSNFYETRISQLRERQADLEKLIIQLTEPSVELDARKTEIGLLQQIANDLQLQVELVFMESDAPSRIEQVQRAEASPVE